MVSHVEARIVVVSSVVNPVKSSTSYLLQWTFGTPCGRLSGSLFAGRSLIMPLTPRVERSTYLHSLPVLLAQRSSLR
jgi:hypothetical protein